MKPKIWTAALRGTDIVDSVVRLCAMNLYLHGIGGDECPIITNDSLEGEGHPGSLVNPFEKSGML